MKRIHRNDRILTPVEGGFALKPATCDGWLLEGGRFVSDAELAAMAKALGDEQVATGAWILGDK